MISLDLVISIIKRIVPHALIILMAWKMTLGLGAIFFHKLKFFNIFKFKFEPEQTTNQKDQNAWKNLGLTGYQLFNIPFVDDFLFLISIPGIYLALYAISFIKCLNFLNPDILLFYLIILLLLYPILKLMKVMKGYLSLIKMIHVIMSLSLILFIYLIYFQKFNLSNREFIILALTIVIKSILFSNGPIIAGKNYNKFNYLSAELLNFKEFHEILQSLYSQKSVCLIKLWNYINVFIFVLFFFISSRRGFKVAIYFLVISSSIQCALNFVVSKKFIQYQLIYILVPFLQAPKDEKSKDMKDYLQSIGPLAFGINVLPILHIVVILHIIDSLITGSNASFFVILLLNGIYLQSSQILVSLYLYLKNPQ